MAGNPNWVKGKSANPGGKKPIDPKIKKALEAATIKAVNVLISLLDSKDEDIRYKAANSIIDRNLGKPAQAHTLSNPDGSNLTLHFDKSDEQL